MQVFQSVPYSPLPIKNRPSERFLFEISVGLFLWRFEFQVAPRGNDGRCGSYKYTKSQLRRQKHPVVRFEIRLTVTDVEQAEAGRLQAAAGRHENSVDDEDARDGRQNTVHDGFDHERATDE